MMVDSETYYENEIKGKNAEEIKKLIARLKRKIRELKYIVEHPNYIPRMLPSEKTKILCYQEYLRCAKIALEELGEKYDPTASERRAMDFDSNIQNISRIILKIEGFFIGWSEVVAEIDDKVVINRKSTMVIPDAPFGDTDGSYDVDKEGFIEYLRSFHIGEWRKNYDTKRFGIHTLDGYSWELRIEYNNGKDTFVCGGDNAYPYNFDNLAEMLAVDLSSFLE